MDSMPALITSETGEYSHIVNTDAKRMAEKVYTNNKSEAAISERYLIPHSTFDGDR